MNVKGKFYELQSILHIFSSQYIEKCNYNMQHEIILTINDRMRWDITVIFNFNSWSNRLPRENRKGSHWYNNPLSSEPEDIGSERSLNLEINLPRALQKRIYTTAATNFPACKPVSCHATSHSHVESTFLDDRAKRGDSQRRLTSSLRHRDSSW